MTEPIVELTLGMHGFSYVRECLSIGKALSQSVLGTIDLESGVLTTFLPSAVPPTEVSKFWSGGKMGEDTAYMIRNSQAARFGRVHNSNSLFLSLICDHVESNSSAFCILEDQLARPGDHKLLKIPAPMLSDGSNIYYLTSAIHTDRFAIEQTFNRALSIRPPLVAFLAHDPVPLFEGLTTAINNPDFRQVASNLDGLILGAYDGESFVRWRRSE